MALTITPVGAFSNANNGGSGAETLAFSTQNIGDCVGVAIAISSASLTVTGITDTNSRITWTKILDGASTYYETLWLGVVTSVGATVITPAYSATPAVYCFVNAQEFQPSQAVTWSIDKSSGPQANGSNTTVPFPSLAPATAGPEIYFGYGFVANDGTAGSGSGVTYTLDTDTNIYCYDTTVTATCSPVGAQSPAGTSYTIGALITATAVAPSSFPYSVLNGGFANYAQVDAGYVNYAAMTGLPGLLYVALAFASTKAAGGFSSGPASPWTDYDAGAFAWSEGDDVAWQIVRNSPPVTATWDSASGAFQTLGLALLATPVGTSAAVSGAHGTLSGVSGFTELVGTAAGTGRAFASLVGSVPLVGKSTGVSKALGTLGGSALPGAPTGLTVTAA